jgi:hypothetical protein
MCKKVILTEEQVAECLRLYNDELLGSSTISKFMNIHKTIIIRTLKENGVIFGPSGRRNIGGRSVTQKKYESKPEIKTKRKTYNKTWSSNNHKELKKYHTEWREENREQLNEYCRNYERNRRREDPKYRLGARTRTALWTCLKERNVAKYRSTFDLLGYTLEELMNHLEKQFTEGMSWDNYGEWHVDHKLPMSIFQFETVEDREFKICWSLDNLQPLWGIENLMKGSKLL